MQHLEGRGTPVLYIGRKVLKGYIVIIIFCFQTCVRQCGLLPSRVVLFTDTINKLL